MAEAERAHAIRLDFDEIMLLDSTTSVQVPAYLLPDDGGLGEHGTRITLSKLVHESVRNREETVRHRIGTTSSRSNKTTSPLTSTGLSRPPRNEFTPLRGPNPTAN